MKRYWKQILAGLLSVVLLLLWCDIRWGVLSGRRTRLPVLMYHHFIEEPKEDQKDTIVSAPKFREQMTALKEAGFTAVTLQQVLDFINGGEDLPKKPVLITMDDGYTSNLTIAAPILEELGMCATIFVIGINEGEEIYVHDGNPLWQARFAYEEAAPWVEKGIIDVQSHTFDMHQLASYGFSGRDGVRPLEGESHEDYEAALREDLRLSRERRGNRVATDLIAVAYPFGYWTEEADQVLAQEGILFTFTIDEHCNSLYAGKPETLRLMGRFNVTEAWTGAALTDRLERALEIGAGGHP